MKNTTLAEMARKTHQDQAALLRQFKEETTFAKVKRIIKMFALSKDYVKGEKILKDVRRKAKREELPVENQILKIFDLSNKYARSAKDLITSVKFEYGIETDLECYIETGDGKRTSINSAKLHREVIEYIGRFMNKLLDNLNIMIYIDSKLSNSCSTFYDSRVFVSEMGQFLLVVTANQTIG